MTQNGKKMAFPVITGRNTAWTWKKLMGQKVKRFSNSIICVINSKNLRWGGGEGYDPNLQYKSPAHM